MKSTKYHCHVLMIKRFALNDKIRMLAYFLKEFKK